MYVSKIEDKQATRRRDRPARRKADKQHVGDVAMEVEGGQAIRTRSKPVSRMADQQYV